MSEELSERIEDWLLALLRYAITRNAADRAAALTRARSMDCAGSRLDVPHFDFFRRQTEAVCAAITGEGPDAEAEIRRLLSRIEHGRLRHALEAATGPRLHRRAAQGRSWLWKGLARPAPSPSATDATKEN